MPTYDYLCTGCGQTFEVFQRMSDEPISSCSDCGAPARRRITGGTGFIFKGDGFYITDHRSREYRDKAASEAGQEKPAEAPGAASEKGSKGPPSGGEKESAASTSDSGRTSSGADSNRHSSGSESTGRPAGAGSATPSSADGSKR